MIRGQHQHHSVLILLPDHRCRQSDTGGGVPCHGLRQDVFLGQLGQLLVNELLVGGVGHHENILRFHQGRQPLDGFLDHGLPVAGQGQKLLG